MVDLEEIGHGRLELLCMALSGCGCWHVIVGICLRGDAMVLDVDQYSTVRDQGGNKRVSQRYRVGVAEKRKEYGRRGLR